MHSTSFSAAAIDPQQTGQSDEDSRRDKRWSRWCCCFCRPSRCRPACQRKIEKDAIKKRFGAPHYEIFLFLRWTFISCTQKSNEHFLGFFGIQTQDLWGRELQFRLLLGPCVAFFVLHVPLLLFPLSSLAFFFIIKKMVSSPSRFND